MRPPRYMLTCVERCVRELHDNCPGGPPTEALDKYGNMLCVVSIEMILWGHDHSYVRIFSSLGVNAVDADGPFDPSAKLSL